MTKKTYKYGTHTCKTYKKPVGKGFEVGFTLGGKEIFVGNFIHTKEANTWFTLMNNEMRKFSKKYSPTNAPLTWTCKFLTNYMYKCYYSYLDREFSKYHRGFSQALRKDERRYTNFKRKHLPASTHYTVRRAA